MNQKMRRISCKWIYDEVESVVCSCGGKPRLHDQVPNEGRKNIGNVCNDFGSVQCGGRLNRMICQTSGVEWGGGEVPEEIGTFPTGNKYLPSLFPVQRCFVQRL